MAVMRREFVPAGCSSGSASLSSLPFRPTSALAVGSLCNRFHGLIVECRPKPRHAHEPRRALWQTVSCSSVAASNGRPPPKRGVQDVKSQSSLGGKNLEKFFVTCAPGLEAVVAAELSSATIGACCVQIGSTGVSFQGTKCTGVRANLWLRSGTRVLLELASGPLASPRARSLDPVYEFVRSAADWPALLVNDSAPRASQRSRPESKTGYFSGKWLRSSPVQKARNADGRAAFSRNQCEKWNFRTFSVDSRVWDCDAVSSSMFASVRAKDAICDAVKDSCGGSRPDPPQDGSASADVPLFFSLYRNNAILYRDMTGVSLHKRGYRDVMHRAGLNEAVAAAMLTVAGWNPWLPQFESSRKVVGGNCGVLVDPMCGSGTILIEAALMAINSAPGLMRSHWPFELWHDFDPSWLESCRQDAIAAEVQAPQGLRLLGNDIHEGALSLCNRAAEAANIRPMLELSCKDCRDYSPSVSPSLVVVNPPWGSRLADSSENDDEKSLLSTWQALGRFLKTHCSGADVYVLSGNPSVTHAMHMRADKKWLVSVGGTDCRIMHYHVLPPKNPMTLDSNVKLESI